MEQRIEDSQFFKKLSKKRAEIALVDPLNYLRRLRQDLTGFTLLAFLEHFNLFLKISVILDAFAFRRTYASPQCHFGTLGKKTGQWKDVTGIDEPQGSQIRVLFFGWNDQREVAGSHQNIIDEESGGAPVPVSERVNENKLVMESGDDLNGVEFIR